MEFPPVSYQTFIFSQESNKPMSLTTTIPARICVDCSGLIRSVDDVYNSAYCDRCLASVCKTCVIIDEDRFLCEGCFMMEESVNE